MSRSRTRRVIAAVALMTGVSCASGFNPPGSPSTVPHYRIIGPSTVRVGESVALAAREESAAGTDVTRSGVWSSSPLATVSQSGVLTGVTAGAVVVTFTLLGTTATLSVEVKPSAP